ncbi:sulfurtransferase TusA family protein [Acetobacter syzygii]|uniref:UPF0033 domain-containing protein n=1 Tax=Acetobacter syzygii TaxID=146476 RepID=A0A270BW03_9PROT|nr:sulfurtransferase TusA family protein [Acetobacter syzygii]NSL93845.1 sulfurtransferase TusA family protein [Acetobacter syzygii]PAL27079.1 hypothetical protein B9K04_04965 [Acetobacter syzygii]PAL29205.1 hypothetical protein B9K05_00630 [Acetobacter syzygii]GAN71462.1 hypothetical protein Absy_019_028 [Acetobacter syzygii]GBR65068.1 hypothetical protein AA0483_1675 [Acetobacter syzygii NRIC 0483]
MHDTPIPERENETSAAMLDITSEKCPMTFVRTRLALDVLPAGGVLAVRLKGEESHRNVSRSVRALGHSILADVPQPGGSVLLTIRKKEAASAPA